ncbi:MAG TPA: 3-methylornithine--L-lysine ligase PylC [Clostridiales bacterium]|nr:3-methylornithine--L-lysine ligase PylC [Clostridiales bacterium]
MTKVCVVGGRLQGVEALYLAAKAGMETVLIDKESSPLGKEICGRFLCKDVLQYNTDLVKVLEEADFVLPALENKEALTVLKYLSEHHDIRLIYDEHAYQICSSKQRSDAMMKAVGLPVPLHYPGGKAPFIVKPSGKSGSEGVRKIDCEEELKAFFEDYDRKEWVTEEYLTGPSYSLEVMGIPGDYSTYHVTELLMDPVYDCKRVLSCPGFPAKEKAQFESLAVALSEMVRLHGIMDVEVIEHDGVFKILEIDARIPSQTPITVYHATGWNLMSELAIKFGKQRHRNSVLWDKEKYVALEQIQVNGNHVAVVGEHRLADAGVLSHLYQFCGADEALTDYAPGKTVWAATMINVAGSKKELEIKRKQMLLEIEKRIGGDMKFTDPFPADDLFVRALAQQK